MDEDIKNTTNMSLDETLTISLGSNIFPFSDGSIVPAFLGYELIPLFIKNSHCFSIYGTLFTINRPRNTSTVPKHGRVSTTMLIRLIAQRHLWIVSGGRSAIRYDPVRHTMIVKVLGRWSRDIANFSNTYNSGLKLYHCHGITRLNDEIILGRINNIHGKILCGPFFRDHTRTTSSEGWVECFLSTARHLPHTPLGGLTRRPVSTDDLPLAGTKNWTEETGVPRLQSHRAEICQASKGKF